MKTVKNRLAVFSLLAAVIAASPWMPAQEGAPTPEELERLAAIEAFTKKQIAADYPTKFKQAAEEFGVPVEILMGISFAETRHEHLVWPEGEKFSPENGMPRPYGIMSLWDNDFFGYSLKEAAKLIGQDPEVLKKDPLQNMRGAAALLRKYYEETDKPAYAKENSLESWKYAMVKYCGIPDPEFAHQHAFDVYDFLSQGYDQYGIKLPEVPDLDLKEMWEETKRIKEEERKKKEEKWRAEGRMGDVVLGEIQDPNTGLFHAREVGKAGDTNLAHARTTANRTAGVKAEPLAAAATKSTPWGPWAAIVAGAAAVLSVLLFRRSRAPAKK